MQMGNLGWFIMLVCFISFMQWRDQNNAAQEFPQERTNFFVQAKPAAEISPSPLRITSNKLTFARKYKPVGDYGDMSEYCLAQGECIPPVLGELNPCPVGSYCGDFRCAQTVRSSTSSPESDEYCNASRCSGDPAAADTCPSTCFCGVHMCMPYSY